MVWGVSLGGGGGAEVRGPAARAQTSGQGRSKGRPESTDSGEDRERGDEASRTGCGTTTCPQPGQRLGRGTTHAHWGCAGGPTQGARAGRLRAAGRLTSPASPEKAREGDPGARSTGLGTSVVSRRPKTPELLPQRRAVAVAGEAAPVVRGGPVRLHGCPSTAGPPALPAAPLPPFRA